MENTLHVKDADKNEENGEIKEIDAFLEIDRVENSDNAVLRKLLRGPRYYDPDSNWVNCYNCGESDHTVASCAVTKRKKPCYICASLEHNGKQCQQGKGCFICNKSGHRAKNCPEKSVEGFQKTYLCLKCGDSGHCMFTCKAAYFEDDLKEIQCFICKSFGHLCCAEYGKGPSEVSCYICGQLGHTGLECPSSSAPAGAQAETTSTASPSSCNKYGEEGHKARKLVKKRKWSNGKHSHLKDNRNNLGVSSAPHEPGEPCKRNKKESGYSNSSQPKRRGGWISENRGGDSCNGTHWGSPLVLSQPKRRGRWINEDPGEDHNGTQCESPSTPANYRSNHENHGASEYDTGFQFEASSSGGINTGFQHPDLATPVTMESKNNVGIISLGGSYENQFS